MEQRMDLKFMVYQVKYDPGTIAMPTTICIDHHADHHGISVFNRIGRLVLCVVIANLEVEVTTATFLSR